MEKDKLDQLKSDIENVFQRKISSHRDCIALQNHIFLSTEKKIALSSIRRLFGQVVYQGQFTAYTISIFDEYIERQKQTDHPKDNLFTAEWLLHVLENAPTKRINNPFLVQFIRSFYAVQLASSSPIDPQLLKKIAQSKIGRRVFFDQFIYLDELIGSYGMGMQFYLMEETDPEHRAFALTILALKEVLLNNKAKANQYLQLIPIGQENFHPFIQGRIRSIQWYCREKNFYSSKTKSIILSDVSKQNISHRHYKDFPAYELMLLETFWRTQDLDLGFWLTQHTLNKWKKHWKTNGPMDPGYYVVLKELMLKFSECLPSVYKMVMRLPVPNAQPQLASRFYQQLLNS